MIPTETVLFVLADINEHGSFNEEEHTYEWDGRKMESVTRFLHRWEEPFDAEAMAERLAPRRGQSPEEILAEWEASRDWSADMGHRTHAKIEAYLKGAPVPRETAKPGDPEHEAERRFGEWLAWWHKHGDRLETIALEVRLYSPRLGVAGTFDYLGRNLDSGQLHLLDWKTNKRFRKGPQGFDHLKPPFGVYKANEHTKYSIQIGLYRLLLEEWGIETNGGTLVHMGPGQLARAYRAIDLLDQLKEDLWK